MTPLVPKLFLGTPWYGQSTSLDFLSGTAIAASADKWAALIRAPKTGTLDKFELMMRTISLNSASSIRASFQAVSSSVALAPAESADQYRDCAGSLFSTNTWFAPGLITSDGTDTGAKRSVTQGDLLACVLEYTTFHTSDSFQVGQASLPIQPRGFPIAVKKGSGTWGNTNVGSTLILKYSDGTYGAPIQSWIPATGSSDEGGGVFHSGTSPNEAGLLFQVPVSMQVRGVFSYAIPGSNSADFAIKLYDPATHLIGSIAIDATCIKIGGTIFGTLFFFPSDITLLANQNYRLTWVPSTVNALNFYYTSFESEAIKNAVVDSTWKYTYRTSGGGWTDDGTRLPYCFGLLVSAIGDAPSSEFPRRGVSVTIG